MRLRPRRRAHQLTSAHLQAAYPVMSAGGLGGRGVYIGRELYSGASFLYDPWLLYEMGVLRGPSMVVIGEIGYAKSSLIKSYLARQAVFGRRAVVIDPKGEYAPLAAWFGSTPIRLSPGGAVRLNPLDPAAGREGQLAVLQAVVAAALCRPLGPEEQAALDLALSAASRDGEPTLPSVQHHLLNPTPEAAAAVGARPARLARDGRSCALELRRLCEGDLRGMFDGATSGGVDLAARVVVFDLAALFGSPALGILMTCVAAWLDARLRAEPQTKRIVVLDEGWAVLRDLATAEFLRRSWKLARSYGVQNVLVVHRLSDLAAAGGAGSEQVKIAEGLLSDSETRVVLRQSPDALEQTRSLLALSASEIAHVAELPPGVALWRVGGRAFLVEHVRSPHELELTDTDARMRELV